MPINPSLRVQTGNNYKCPTIHVDVSNEIEQLIDITIFTATISQYVLCSL